MSADRRRRAVGAALALSFAVSGCASMPDGGEVTQVTSSHRAEGESRVRVFGVSPQQGESPKEIVRGFLEATTSDEADFTTAREYLTGERAESWRPSAGTTVLGGGPTTGTLRKDPGADDGYSVEVSGALTARVDGNHGYHPEDGEYSADFHLSQTRAGWRIDRLPHGLVVSETDFQRIFRSVDTYYFGELGPDAAAVASAEKVLVADPVYVRGRIDPLTEAVKSLLEGPTDWLEPVVGSAFPDGTELAPGEHLSLDDSNALTVRLNARAARADRARCLRMAAQVLHTVQSQTSPKVSSVHLAGPDGDELCTLPREEAELYEPGRLNGRSTRPYLIDDDHRVATVGSRPDDAKAVEGALGSGAALMGSVAVSRDERQGAAVSLDGGALHVAQLGNDGPLGRPVLTSAARRERDRLTAPSWDGLGDLWIADRDPDRSRLLRLRGGKEKPEEVAVPGLGARERIESLKTSSDGMRIAMRVREADGHSALKLGRVERGGTRQRPEITVAALRSVAPRLEDVVAASWAGPSQLVVVGRESRSVQQLQYVGTDGSTTNQPTLPGINDVRNVTASEDESRPLLAETGYGIVRLPADTNWRTVHDGGRAPAYPG